MSPTPITDRLHRNVALMALLLAFQFTGCAALTNPLADGVPVRRVPPELLAPTKSGEETIPPTLLAQPRPDTYRLEAGDVLGVYVEALGEREQPSVMPIHVGPLSYARDQRMYSPSSGYPVSVEDDGTIYLSAIGKLSVQNLSLPEAREAIRTAYVNKKLLRDDGKLVVSLLTQRRCQVVVLRQESGGFNATQEGPTPSSKRGTGHLIELPAYENDVLHALTATGGLPGLDAFNEVVIYRGGYKAGVDFASLRQQLDMNCAVAGDRHVIRIPLRATPNVPLSFGPADVVLHTGDVVLLEARDEEVFYTGGLLPPGCYILPRDTDLDVIEAVSRVRGPLFNGAFGGSNLSGTLIQQGIGNPSPSLLVVLRKTPGGGQVPIVVDLREAMRHPEERIRVKPGDLLVLQERPGEALARYFSQTFLNFNFAWEVFNEKNAIGVIDIAAPERLPQRLAPGGVILR